MLPWPSPSRLSALALLLSGVGCIVPGAPLDRRDRDMDGYPGWKDCDDLNPDVFLTAEERCNGIDDDCDDQVDEPAESDAPGWYADEDGDGWGDGERLESCDPGASMANRDGDCDDGDPTRAPDVEELCDGIDQDCDDETDEDPSDGVWRWRDVDGDGFGDPAVYRKVCPEEDFFIDNDSDCDDSDPEIHPGATEQCDALDEDEDCDGLVDDADEDATGQAEVYLDRDGDGVGDSESWILACDGHGAYVETGGDCDDQDPALGAMMPLYVDADGDSYGVSTRPVSACEGETGVSELVGDCDDEDPARSPASVEIWYDGIDQDCDGASDYDQDGDGADASDWGGTDCDDQDISFGPSVAEIWYDGSDQDCDAGSDFDQDGDGADASDWGGTDCDDVDVLAYPGSDITAFPGDWDCDGEDELDGERWSDDGTTWSALGAALAIAGDLDGDGLPDLLIGAPTTSSADPGGALILAGPADAGLEAAAATLSGADLLNGRGLGTALVGPGDVDGDGYDDVAISVSDMSSRYHLAGGYLVFQGPLVGAIDADDADYRVEGTTTEAELGQALGSADVDGDGIDEILVGAPLLGSTRPQGRVYVVPADADGNIDAVDTATLLGAGGYDRVGASVNGAGDMDGDGLEDIAIGAPELADDTGRVWLVPGATTGSHYIDDVGVQISGLNHNDLMGTGLDGGVDVDGDGYCDLLAGAPQKTVDDMENAGTAWLFAGPITSDIDASAYTVRFRGGAAGELLGYSVSFAGDVDGDGSQDVAVGAPGVDSVRADRGELRLFLGPLEGSYETEDATLSLFGTSENQQLGARSVGGADLNGDGYAELLGGGGRVNAAGEVLLLWGGQ